MTRILSAIGIILGTGGAVLAQQSMLDRFGAGARNEAIPGDISTNPDGCYIRSHGIQLSHRDPRIVRAEGEAYFLCTRSAATPAMDASRAISVTSNRVVKYLFARAVPPQEAAGF